MTHTALVLAGHGSHISPQTAGIVWQYVDALRAMQVADEVTAAFWKESPSFHSVFDTLCAQDVTVVPLFTAQGYFTQSVIPAEMGLQGAQTLRQGRMIRYCRPVGEHPYLSQIVQQRLKEGIDQSGAAADQIAVAILGHSTKRNPESRKATERQVELIRQLAVAAEVVALYLDDEPGIAELYQLTQAPVIIAVPYFLALGSHTTIDVPVALGLLAGQRVGLVQGRMLYYTEPIGVDDALPQVIVELARQAGATLQTNPVTALEGYRAPAGNFFPQGGHADLNHFVVGFPKAGHDLFAHFIEHNRRPHVTFGQLLISSSDIRHVDDVNRRDLLLLTEPNGLRTYLRADPFRPLATSSDLPDGWRVPLPEMMPQTSEHHYLQSSAFICGVIETIYPGALADWAAQQQGMFGRKPLSALVARQTGMFRRLAQLNEEQTGATVQRVCMRCVRQPTWFFAEDPAVPLDAVRQDCVPRLEFGEKNDDKGAIPCSEPCNLWLSTALEQLMAA